MLKNYNILHTPRLKPHPSQEGISLNSPSWRGALKGRGGSTTNFKVFSSIYLNKFNHEQKEHSLYPCFCWFVAALHCTTQSKTRHRFSRNTC